MENYLVAMAVSAGLYALMALGLNVIWGMAGLVNLAMVMGAIPVGGVPLPLYRGCSLDQPTVQA